METSPGLNSLLAELTNSRSLPEGQVLKTRSRGWHHRLLYLAADPQAAVPERPVPVPARLSKAHPTAVAYRLDRDHHEVSSGHLARAVRIVHALAVALEDLGYDMGIEPHRVPDGQFVVQRDGFGVALRLSEVSAPHGAPVPHYDDRRTKPLPSWQARRQKQFIATGRLVLLVGGAYSARTGRQLRFADTRSRSLETTLPRIVREVEMRYFEHHQEATEAAQEERVRDAQWQRVVASAKTRALDAHRVQTLTERAQAWSRWKKLTAYTQALADHLNQLPEAQRDQAQEWLAWATTYLGDHSPLSQRNMPPEPEFTGQLLAPHIKGWAGPLRSFD